MSNERQMWSDHVRPAMAAAGLDPVRVENSAHPGTPDVNFREGWLELKDVKKWPKMGGPVNINHFTPQQRVWLHRRWRGGGNVWLLLRCEKEWMLFDGWTAAARVGYANQAELHEIAAVWTSPFVFNAHLLWLANVPFLQGDGRELRRQRLRAMKTIAEAAVIGNLSPIDLIRAENRQ